jgi:coenzyme PQQ precursor peptide PqqA
VPHGWRISKPLMRRVVGSAPTASCWLERPAHLGLDRKSPAGRGHSLQRKEVKLVEWITPDFEEVDTSAEVTAYAGRWDSAD